MLQEYVSICITPICNHSYRGAASGIAAGNERKALMMSGKPTSAQCNFVHLDDSW